MKSPQLIEDLLASRYRRIIDTAAEGIWVIDAAARTAFVNASMAAMLGYAAEEMQGRALFDFMDDEWRAIARDLLARRHEGIAEAHEFKFVRKDGATLWGSLAATPIVDDDGTFTGALAMVRDVTAHRQAEDRFRSLFENSPNALWEEDLSAVKARVDELRAAGVTDFRAYVAEHPRELMAWLQLVKVLDVNQAAVRLYEAGTKEALLSGLGRLLTPESIASVAELFIALTEGRTVVETEGTDQTFTGKKNHMLIKTLVAPGCETTWARVYISGVDITGRKLLEEQLRQSQKMEAIGRLAGGVAHDFNNLLTVIRGNASMLQGTDLSEEHRAEALREIEVATERAAGLTRQLLTFSRRQVLQQRQLDLNDVVAGLSRMLERVLGEDVRFELRLNAQPLPTRADAGMMDQVLMNLVVNARDAMPEGGRLVIETFRAELSDADRARFPEARPGPHVCVRVADTGSGIAPELMTHIFEPFFTTKGPGQGTGLGLATVFGIVEQHGGALRVESQVGRGTTVWAFFPASSDDGLAADAGEAPRAPRGGTESVLLVEDEEPVRKLAQRVLESRGYRVRTAATGAQALRICQQEPGAFDLVVTDMVMPGGVSGRELGERLAASQPSLKIVYMSGYAGDVAGEGISLRAGFNFLPKPFDATSLLDCVRARLDGG